MATLSKIKNVYLKKFNNSEHLSFMMRTGEQIGDTVEAAAELGISADTYNAFNACLDKLEDIVKQSRISDETAQMNDADLQRTRLALHLFISLRAARYAPLASHRSAAIHLYNVIKPSTVLCRKPKHQKTSIISAILMDLKAPEQTKEVALLNLTETRTQLEATNTLFMRLTRQRSASQIKRRLGNAQPVRLKTDRLYNDIMALVFVTSISKPTARTADFIVHQNKYIDEANASYKLRKALKRKKPAKGEIKKPDDTTPDKPEGIVNESLD